MEIKPFTVAIYSCIAITLSAYLFCGDPSKPDFEITPEIANDSIITQGTPAVDSTFLMYIIMEAGTEPFTFQWVKNDTTTLNETTDSLQFTSLTLEDNGTYRCIVSNDYGNDTSLAYTLTVTSNEVDTTKPLIKLKSPPDNSITSDSLVQVELVITDKSGIASVTINDNLVTSSDSIYTDTVILSTGVNTIKVIAVDASPNSNKDSINVTVTYDPSFIDTTAPEITLLSPPDSTITADSLLEVTYKVRDESGISMVTIDDNAVTSNDSIYKHTVTLTYGENTIKTVAVDASQNNNSNTRYSTFYYDSTFEDTVGPAITLNKPDDSTVIKDSSIQIEADINDISGIAWVTIDGDTVDPTKGTYIKNVSLDPDINKIEIVSQDNSTSKNLNSLLCTVFRDNQNPSLQLLQPGIDSSSIGSSSKKVEVIAKDNYGIKAVSFRVGSNLFQTSSLFDTIYFATITDLQPNVFTLINVEAEDTAGNKTPLEVAIKYDPTIVDEEPPAITHASGPNDNDRVTSATDTIGFTITDDNDIDTAYFTLNGVYVADLSHISGDTYECSFDLGTKYGNNTITIFAADGSTNHNLDSAVIRLLFNTIPSDISNISPANQATDIENIGGVTISWDAAVDDDLDPITYKLFYGTSPSNLNTTTVSSQTQHTFTTFQGATEYIWYVEYYTVLDTLRSPSAPTSYYRFTTRNHDATITSFPDMNSSIGDQVTFTVVASDPEGIKEYRWTFNNGQPTTTTSNSHTITAPGSANTYTMNVVIIDNMDGETSDDAILTVTNNAPVITAIRNDTTITINDVIPFTGTASDADRTIVEYAWDFDGNGSYDYTSSTTMNTTHSYSSTGSNTAQLRVRDEDSNEDTEPVTITVIQDNPTASINYTGANPAKFGTSISIDGVSSDGYGTIVKHEWNIGNTGFVEMTEDITITAPYIYLPQYSIVYRVTDDDGNQTTSSTLNLSVGIDWEAVGAAVVTSDAHDGDPSIAVYNDVPYVAYITSDDPAQLYVKRYTNGSWQTVGSNIVDTGEDPSRVVLKVSENGTFYMLYYGETSKSSISNVKQLIGNTWTQLGLINFGQGYGCFRGNLTIYNNIPYIVSPNQVADSVFVKYNYGNGWEYVTGFLYTDGYYPSHLAINIDQNATPHITFHTEWNGQYIRKYSSNTWSVVGNTVSCYFSANALDIRQNNTPYFCMKDNASTNAKAVQLSNNLWTNLGNPATFSQGEIMNNIECSTDSLDYPYAAYIDKGLSDKIVVKRLDGTIWAALGTEGFATGYQKKNISFTIEEGKPYIAFQNASHQVIVMRFR